MSLTSMLRNRGYEEFHEVCKEIIPRKNDFRTNVTYPAFSHEYPVLAPNNLSQVYYSAVVGTAFDFMARVLIARILKKDQLQVLDGLIAEKALRKSVTKDNKLNKKLRDKYDLCIKECRKYILGKSNDYVKILPLSCYLAKLEHIIRSGYPPSAGYSSLLEDIDKEITDDLHNICTVFYDVFIKSAIVHSDSEIIFNPTMGKWSTLCGGADADIFVDGVLYDFKTSIQLGYKWKEVAQLYGYYLLYLLEGDEDVTREKWINTHEIKSIAFYRARFGVIEKYVFGDRSELVEEKSKFKKCIENEGVNKKNNNENELSKYLEQLKNREALSK